MSEEMDKETAETYISHLEDITDRQSVLLEDWNATWAIVWNGLMTVASGGHGKISEYAMNVLDCAEATLHRNDVEETSE